LQVAGIGTAAAAMGVDQAAAVAPPNWEKLRKRLAGSLYLPRDSEYAQAKQGFFTLYDAQHPAAIARCTRVEDVQACIETAVSSKTRIAARSGGHSYAGYSTPDAGLVVDLSRLNTVQINQDGTAVVGAGTQLIDLYEALAKAGRLLPAGSCPSVGIAGLALGGGLGVVARKYGLTCDRIIGARIVTQDSRVRDVSAAKEPDLFWALCGGGGGNFGIVTSFTFRTAPEPPALTNFEVEFPARAIAALLGGWQDWIAAAPDELWSGFGVSGDPAATTWVSGCFVGTEQALKPWLDDLVRRVGEPVTRRITQLGTFQMMQYYAGCAELSTQECHPAWNASAGLLDRGSYVSTSRMMTKPMRDPQAMATLLKSSPGLYTIIDSFGGVIARVKETDTPFPYRKALASMQIIHGVDGNEAFARQAIGHVRDGLTAEFGVTGYVNYIDPQMPSWQQAYYGANLARLKAVARRYDPYRSFGFPQGITP
jgi:hypothetical protein